MIEEFVEELKRKNIQISFSKGKLRYTGPEEYIDAEMLSRLKEYKSRLLKYYWPEECINMMPVNTYGDRVPLVIIHAGGSNYTISDALEKDRPYYGFFNIGSEGENVRYKSVNEFASVYLKQLENILPDQEFYLGGFSFGGILAYEIAIQLQKKGRTVPMLFLGDATFQRSKNLKISFKKKLIRALKNVYYFGFDIFVKVMLAIVSGLYTKIPIGIRKNYIVWTYIALVKSYKSTEKYNGKIVLFRATENKNESTLLGWDNVCDNVDLVEYEGGHYAMYDSIESIDIIKKHIREKIQQFEKSNVLV